MTQADLMQYRTFWQKRNLVRPTPEMSGFAQAARQEAQRLAQILAAEFEVERVFLFGSFAWGPEMHPESDLDLAVEGLAPENLVFAHARLSSASRYGIDLVLLERAPHPLYDLILQSGIIVHDRHSKPAAD